jgi:hypothetical protein
MKRPHTKIGPVVDRLLEQLSDPPPSQAQTDSATDRVLQRLRSIEVDDFATVSETSTPIPRWSWTVAAATLIAALALPVFVLRPKPNAKARAEVSAEAVMERLNRHLAGTVPEPMEPMLTLISDEQPESQKGEVQ